MYFWLNQNFEIEKKRRHLLYSYFPTYISSLLHNCMKVGYPANCLDIWFQLYWDVPTLGGENVQGESLSHLHSLNGPAVELVGDVYDELMIIENDVIPRPFVIKFEKK